MPKRVFENPVPATRCVALHGEFKPDGNPRENLQPLMDLWIELQSHLNRVKGRELRQQAREQQELEEAINKLSPLVASGLRGERDAALIADDIVRLVPDETLRSKVLEWYTDQGSQMPETQSLEEQEAEKKELDGRYKALKCSSAILDAFTQLSDAMERGDPAAAKELLQAATTAAGFLTIATKRHPQQFKELAAMTKTWPVLASDEPGWEKAAVSQVNRLELGKGLAFFETRLRPLRGSDVALPARRWAKAAVQTIDETRWRVRFFVHLVDELGGSSDWADFAVRHNWDVTKRPDWTKVALALKPLSAETFDSWKVVVREIIREQVADFHLLPEWTTQRMTAEANGRDTPGEIQNAILDDIVSTLKRLVPEARC